MTPGLVALVLGAAVLHATWNALVKGGGNPLYTLSGLRLVGTVYGGAVLLFVPPPAAASWPWLLASVAIHNVYYYTMVQSYRHGDLSQVYPLFRGLAPVLVAGGAVFLVDERLGGIAIAGIIITSIGLMSLTFERGWPRDTSAVALLWGLATGLMIAGYTLVDGVGMRSADSRFGYIAWLFFVEGLPLALWTLLIDRTAFAKYLRRHWSTCVIAGLAACTAYGMVLFAMSRGALAVVSSLRETSVIFAAVIGMVFLREPFARIRIIAAVLVACGIIILQLGMRS